MAQFDPYKKPMSLAESEELLKGHDQNEASKDAWKSFGGLLLFILALVGIALVAFLSVSVKIVGWIVGIAGVVYALGAIANTTRK